MKLKFLLVLLVVLGFTMGSYADCSKDEIIDMMNKGISSSIINTTCGKKSVSKWITPSKSVCISNGGRIKNGECRAKWSNAKDICSALNSRLPTKYELEKIVTSCGGILDSTFNGNNSKKNKGNSSYQSCRKNKGFFSSTAYWSSSIDYSSNAWFVLFFSGSSNAVRKEANLAIRCIK